MTQLVLRSAVCFGALAMGFLDSQAVAQSSGAQGPYNAQQPFNSLRDLLSNVGNTYTSLGAQQKVLQSTKNRLDPALNDLWTAQQQLQQSWVDLNDRKASLNNPKGKWRCHAYGTIHDSKSECDDPSQGFDWVPDPNAPPPPDPQQLQQNENQLKATQKQLDSKKSSLDQQTQDYTKAATDYNSQTDDLGKKIAGLPDPSSAINDMRLTFDENAKKTLNPTEYAKGQAALANLQGAIDGRQLVGSGQCTDLVKKTFSLGASSTWTPGTKVSDLGQITAPVPAATFFDGKYPNYAHGNHAVNVVDALPDGTMLVVEQWSGSNSSRPPGFRMLKPMGGINAPQNQALIQQGMDIAATQGLSPTNNPSAYYGTIYSNQRYNPGSDASNYSLINQGGNQ